MSPNALTVTTALIGSGVLASIISSVISSLMTRHTNNSVERLKSGLERGLYVTKAHYDLELDSFKTMWAALNDLRLKVRGFLGPDRFKIRIPDGEPPDWYTSSYPRVLKDFFAAHDNIVKAVTMTSPFYPSAIGKTAQKAFDIDMAIIRVLQDLNIPPMSEQWFAEIRQLSAAIDQQVHEVEGLIRSRLENLRVLS